MLPHRFLKKDLEVDKNSLDVDSPFTSPEQPRLPNLPVFSPEGKAQPQPQFPQQQQHGEGPSRAEPTDQEKTRPKEEDVQTVAYSEKSVRSSSSRVRMEEMRSDLAQTAAKLRLAEETIKQLKEEKSSAGSVRSRSTYNHKAQTTFVTPCDSMGPPTPILPLGSNGAATVPEVSVPVVPQGKMLERTSRQEVIKRTLRTFDASSTRSTSKNTV